MTTTVSAVTDNNFSTPALSGTQARNITRRASTLDDYHCGLITLSIFILICNLFAIEIYKRHEKIRRNCGNVLLLSLTISDLMLGLVYLPVLIFCESQWTKYDTNDNFVKGCRTNYFVGNFSSVSTVFHIVALTIEKYVAVLHPFQRLSVSTRGTYRKILIIVWFLSFAFSVVPAFWMYEGAWMSDWKRKFDIYGLVQAVIFLGLATLILMYCYIRMFFQIHIRLSWDNQTGRVQAKARNDRKTVLIFLSFFTIFVVGWTPWFFFNLKDHHQYLVSLKVKDFLISLRHCGAVINPLLYSFVKNDYKQAIQSDIRSLCSCCASTIGFQKLYQTSTLHRNNNTLRRATLTTGTAEVKLRKIEPSQDPNGSFVSGSSTGRLPSQSEDTDL